MKSFIFQGFSKHLWRYKSKHLQKKHVIYSLEFLILEYDYVNETNAFTWQHS